jgi:hypothetical protein
MLMEKWEATRKRGMSCSVAHAPTVLNWEEIIPHHVSKPLFHQNTHRAMRKSCECAGKYQMSITANI